MIDSIERGGRVIALDGDMAQVRLDAASACSGCGSRGTCGSGNKAEQVIRMAVPAHVRLGDTVTLAMPSSSVALAALLGYLLPPAALLAGAVIGAGDGGDDLHAVIGAGVGLLAGLALARLISRFTLHRNVEPSICGPVARHGEQP
jgi:positive regulator of sigma E activity